MKFLRRDLAPLSERAWTELEQQARNVLLSNLSARRFVDVNGPHGWDLSSVNLGRVGENVEREGVRFAVRRVQPLVELRVDFVVSRDELDNFDRGAEAVDVESAQRAAVRAARFEEAAVHHGHAEAGIEGLVKASTHDPVGLGREIARVPACVTAGLIQLADAGVGGPYALVLGDALYRGVTGNTSGYPVRQQLIKLLGSEPIYSPALSGGLLVSTRGGDFVLTLGADFSLGFDRSEGDAIHLFLTESFTFRVTAGEAVVVLQKE